MRRAVLLVLSLCASLCADDAEQQGREEILQGSRLRAEATNIFQLVDGKRVDTDVLSEPLFRYTDEPRDILDATLWAHGTPGRPIAFQKIELYHRPDGNRWFYCTTSLSESLIEADWRDGQAWSSKQPGITFRDLPDGPRAATSEVARLFQMKQLARRFDATLFDKPNDLRVEMRPLSRPIYRYADPDRGIQDGAIFAFATSGTNPDTLLSIESRGQRASEPMWKYGLARMTLCQVTVKLDDEEVWQVPYFYPQGPGRPSKFDTWLFFYESKVNAAIK